MIGVLQLITIKVEIRKTSDPPTTTCRFMWQCQNIALVEKKGYYKEVNEE